MVFTPTHGTCIAVVGALRLVVVVVCLFVAMSCS